MLFKVTDTNTNNLIKYIRLCIKSPELITNKDFLLIKDQVHLLFSELAMPSFTGYCFTSFPVMFNICLARKTYLATEITSQKRRQVIENAKQECYVKSYNIGTSTNTSSNYINYDFMYPAVTAATTVGAIGIANTAATTPLGNNFFQYFYNNARNDIQAQVQVDNEIIQELNIAALPDYNDL